MNHHPELLWLLIGVLVIGTVAVSLAMDRANSGEHARLAGNVWAIPAGDRTNPTRHAWRPGAGEDTIRVADLVARIAGQYGRHALIEDPPAVDEAPAVDEGQGDGEPTQPLYTHPYPLLNLAA